MKAYCPNNENHKCWSDAIYCTVCGTKLKKEALICGECKRKQFPVSGEKDSSILYCAYCGSWNLQTIEEV